MDCVDREAVLRILSEYDVPQVVRTKIKCLSPQDVNSSMKEVLPGIPHDLEKGLGFGIGDVNIRETLEPESMQSQAVSWRLSCALNLVESIKTIVYVDHEDTAPGYDVLDSVKTSIRDAISYFDKRNNEEASYWGIFR